MIAPTLCAYPTNPTLPYCTIGTECRFLPQPRYGGRSIVTTTALLSKGPTTPIATQLEAIREIPRGPTRVIQWLLDISYIRFAARAWFEPVRVHSAPQEFS